MEPSLNFAVCKLTLHFQLEMNLRCGWTLKRASLFIKIIVLFFFPVSDIFCDRSAFFFVEGNQHWGGENYHDVLESGTIFGANKLNKERKKYFLNCLNSSQSTHNKPPHQLFNIFPSSSFPFSHFFFQLQFNLAHCGNA